MTTESLYSRSVSFKDAKAQAIWQQRQWSAKQIAGDTAIGFGLGAFFGAAG